MRLTPRQTEILQMLANGLTDKEVAVRLRISQRTVRTHVERLYIANGIHTRTNAVALWLRSPGPDQGARSYAAAVDNQAGVAHSPAQETDA